MNNNPVAPLPEIASPSAIYSQEYIDGLRKEIVGVISWYAKQAPKGREVQAANDCLAAFDDYIQEHPFAAPVPLGEPAQTFEQAWNIFTSANDPGEWNPRDAGERFWYTALAYGSPAALASKAVPLGEGELPPLDITEDDLLHVKSYGGHAVGAGGSNAALRVRERQLLQSLQRERGAKAENEKLKSRITISCGRQESFKKRAQSAEAELSRLRSQEGPAK